MYVGALSIDVLLGDVRSLNDKRSVVRSVFAELRRRQAEFGVAVVASSAAHCAEVLEACERVFAARPDIELLAARQRLFNEHEEA